MSSGVWGRGIARVSMCVSECGNAHVYVLCVCVCVYVYVYVRHAYYVRRAYMLNGVCMCSSE